MIEPQNTMLPIVADSATVEVPSGEGGFGEMLAQTLGMGTVDPNAIFGLAEQAQGEESEEGAELPAEGGNAETSHTDQIPVPRYIGVPINAEVVVAKPVALERPPVDDSIVTDPVFTDEESPEVPIASVPIPKTEDRGIFDPIPTEATDVASDVAPPVGRDEVPAVAAPVPEGEAIAQLDPNPVPVDRAAPPENTEPAPVRPIIPPVASEGRAPSAPLAAATAQPAIADDAVRPRVSDRGIPTTPVPTVTAPTSSPVEKNVARDVANPLQVPLEDNDVKLSTTPVQLTDPAVSVESRPISSALPTVAIDGLQSPGTPATEPTIPATPTQHSALAERVLQAVELQANQPPPRTMVVDIPEIEGLRLVVSVRSGSEVHVVQASNSAAGDGFQPFMDELQGVLEGRGFVMTGDGRRRGNSRYQNESEQQPLPRRPRTATRPGDGDLRI